MTAHSAVLCKHTNCTVYCHADAQGIVKSAAEMRTAAQAEMVLDEESEELVVIDYLTELLQRAEAQQSQQEIITKHQSFLKLPVMVNGDLALAKEEVCAPASLTPGKLLQAYAASMTVARCT